MSLHAEATLVAHLVDEDSLRYLQLEGIDEEILPTEKIQPIVRFALDYHGRSAQAPTATVLAEEFGDALGDYCREQGVDLGEPDDSIEWAVQHLKGTSIAEAHTKILAAHAEAMIEAEPGEQAVVLDEHITDLMSIARFAQRRDRYSDFSVSVEDRMQEFLRRAEDPGAHQGLVFGMDMVDDYTHGIRPGELAMCAGPAKTGKSYFSIRVALDAWRSGESVVLYTLENDVEMTENRLICLAAGVSSERWQTGSSTPEERDRVAEFFQKRDTHPFWVLQPETGKRGATRLVREAAMREASVLIIDQLSEMEHPNPDARRGRRDLEVRDILTELRAGITEARDRLPCLLMHQISRAGAEAARKLGRMDMEHLAESAAAERVCDWVFAIHQSAEERIVKVIKLQTLAARRADLRHFRLAWDLDRGIIEAIDRLTLESAA